MAGLLLRPKSKGNKYALDLGNVDEVSRVSTTRFALDLLDSKLIVSGSLLRDTVFRACFTFQNQRLRCVVLSVHS